jgi:hypothetical protein
MHTMPLTNPAWEKNFRLQAATVEHDPICRRVELERQTNSDTDAEGTRKNMLRMIAIKERLPQLIIVPAHDMRAYAEMPTLSQASREPPAF